MTAIRQASFAGGELSPTLYGRADLEKYGVSLRRMRNFFAARQGAAVSRPGTTYCGSVKFATPGTDGPVKLVPFVYSDAVAYVLEFGHGYIRLWQNGAPVLSGGVPYEVATPYTITDVPLLKYAQVGAVLTLTHASYPPAELTYTSATSWAYSAVSFDRPDPGATNFYLQEPLPTPDVGNLYSSVTTYNKGSLTSYGGQTWQSLSDSNAGHIPTDPLWWVKQPDASIAREWQWQVTQVWRAANGVPYETKPYTISQQARLFYTVWSPLVTYKGGAHGVGTQVLSQGGSDGGTAGQVYRSLLSNNLNHLLSDATWWVLDNTVTSPAPKQVDSLPGTIVCEPGMPVTLILNSAYANALTDPNFLGYRVYRGRGGLMGLVGEAKSNVSTFTDDGDTPDYSQQPPQGRNPFKSFDASGTLTGTQYPAAVCFFEERRCFARSNTYKGTIWMSNVGDYANFDSHKFPVADEALQLELASRKVEEVRSLVGVGPRLLALTNSAVWVVGDDSGPVQFDNLGAKVQLEVGASWVDPLNVDGACLFVRTKGTGVRAVQFDLQRQGLAGSDLSIMASHLFVGHQVLDWCHAEDPWSLVLAVREDGVLLALTYVREHDVWAWAWYDTAGTFESICSIPEGTEDAVYVVVNRTVGGVAKRYVERFASRVVTQATVNKAVCLDCAVVQDLHAAPADTITGLGHLEGLQVYALADGNVMGPYTVSGGAVTLDEVASYAVVGLLYTPELETLDAVVGGAEVKAVDKQVHRVDVEVDNSRGLQVGPDADNLTEWEQRSVADGYSAVGVGSTLIRQDVLGAWGTEGRVFLRQTVPLPLTVLSITREVEFGDR